MTTMETNRRGAATRTAFYGKYRGTVIDNNDPQSMARLKAIVPAVLGTVPTGWALPCSPYAGPLSGLHVVPPVGAGVWMEFEGGDPDYPIWTGGWWGSGQLPPEETAKPARPPLKILRSDRGLIVALDDDDQTIAISDISGTNLLEVRVLEGTVHVQAAARVVLEAPSIELVQGAPHPLVFGDRLLQYLNLVVALFNGHQHVGQTAAGILPVSPAPPVAPFPTPDPSLLSTRVRAG